MRPAAALPNLLTGLRLALIPILSLVAIAGQGRLVGFGLLAAGTTDFLDGYAARRLGVAGPAGARLDAAADNLLLLAAAAWVWHFHPAIVLDNLALSAASVYVVSLIAGVLRFGRTSVSLYSSKVAGGCLYAFALITFVTGNYLPAVVTLAATALLVSSMETVVAAVLFDTPEAIAGTVLKRLADMTMTEAIATARKQRSQTPHAVNPEGASVSAMSSSTTMVVPSPRETLT